MRYKITFLATFLIAGLATSVTGQEPAKERAANLRLQLTQVQTQQEELQARLRQLEEDMKPENIEKTYAGVGSTRPEDLREQRRRQLEIEKKGVQHQLDLLAASRTRLETRLAQADNDAYHESAGLNPDGKQSSSAQPAATTAPTSRRPARRTPRKRSKPRRINKPA